MSEEKAPKKTDAATVMLYLGMAWCIIEIGWIVVDFQFLGGYKALYDLLVSIGFDGYPGIPILIGEISQVLIWLVAYVFLRLVKSEYRENGFTAGAAILSAVVAILVARFVVWLTSLLWGWLVNQDATIQTVGFLLWGVPVCAGVLIFLLSREEIFFEDW